jgi:hypothetical protein
MLLLLLLSLSLPLDLPRSILLYCIYSTVLKLSNYFSLDLLPASHLDVGDMDKMEERILHIYCTVHRVADTNSKTRDLIYCRPHP